MFSFQSGGGFIFSLSAHVLHRLESGERGVSEQRGRGGDEFSSHLLYASDLAAHCLTCHSLKNLSTFTAADPSSPLWKVNKAQGVQSIHSMKPTL